MCLAFWRRRATLTGKSAETVTKLNPGDESGKSDPVGRTCGGGSGQEENDGGGGGNQFYNGLSSFPEIDFSLHRYSFLARICYPLSLSLSSPPPTSRFLAAPRVTFMPWPRAEFPARVVNRIIKTSEPPYVRGDRFTARARARYRFSPRPNESQRFRWWKIETRRSRWHTTA